MPDPHLLESEGALLADLSKAVEAAPRKVQEIEVGIALSIVLGKQRPAMTCGGCKTPLEFQGIPARTNVRLGAPFRLIFADAWARDRIDMVSLPIVEIVVNFIIWAMRTLGLPGLVALMTVESFGIPPLPSEVILPFAGYLVVTGYFPLVPTILAALLGGVLGAYIAYGVGRYARHVLLMGPKFLRLEPRHLEMVDRWFAKNGEWTVFGSRLLPVVRSFVSYPAGTAKMEPVRFGLYTLAGATPFTLALIYAGIVLGQHWSDVLPIFHLLDYAVVAVLVVGGIYFLLRWRNVITGGWPPHRAA